MTSPTGERYRVVFQVSYVSGKTVARIISAEYIEGRLAIAEPANSSADLDVESEILSLPCASVPIIVETKYVSGYAPKISPFTSLLFFTSQPTRAPSFLY